MISYLVCVCVWHNDMTCWHEYEYVKRLSDDDILTWHDDIIGWYELRRLEWEWDTI